MATHFEHGTLHTNPVHPNGFQIGISLAVEPTKHEGTLLGDIFGNASTIVDDFETIWSRDDVSPVTLVWFPVARVLVLSLQFSDDTIDTVVEKIENRIGELDIPRQHSNKKCFRRAGFDPFGRRHL
jgi:hypothetical protein